MFRVRGASKRQGRRVFEQKERVGNGVVMPQSRQSLLLVPNVLIAAPSQPTHFTTRFWGFGCVVHSEKIVFAMMVSLYRIAGVEKITRFREENRCGMENECDVICHKIRIVC